MTSTTLPMLSSTSDPNLLQVEVSYDQVDKGGLELRYPYGFELGCAVNKGNIPWTAMHADSVCCVYVYKYQ